MSALHLTVKVATRILEVAVTLVVAAYLALGVGLLGLRYAVLPNIQQFVPWMEQAGTRAFGLQVHIGQVQARWTGLLPTLMLHDLVIDNPQGAPALQLDGVQITPSWKSLPRMQIALEQLVINGVDLRVSRPAPNHLDIGGIDIDLAAPGTDATQRFADWLFEQDQILIRHSRLTWTDTVRRSPPLVLRDVDIELRTSLLRHRAALRARAVPPPGATQTATAPFEIRADFHQPLFLRHRADFARWHGQLWASVPQLDIAEAARDVPLPPQILTGVGAVQAWVDVGAGYKITQAVLDAALDDVQVRPDQALPPLAFRTVAGRASYAPLDGGMRLTTSALTFTMADGQRLPPQAAFSGLGWRSPAAPAALGLPARLPGLDGLSGTVQATQDAGRATVTMRGGAVLLPAVFEDPRIPVDRLRARLDWSHGTDGSWTLRGDGMQFSNTDAAGTATVQYTVPARGPAWLGLSARLNRADARAMPRYLPLAIPVATRDYLRTAIAGGRSSDVRFEIRGPVADIPFDRRADGIFSITASIEGGVYNAAPRKNLPSGQQARETGLRANALWPEFRAIKGQLALTGTSMTVRDASAVTDGATLSHVNLSVPVFARPVLHASGQVAASADDALRYLHDSPLDAMLNHALSATRAQGPIHADVTMQVPLNNPARSTVTGSLALLGDTIDHVDWLPPFVGVRGHVNFTEHGFTIQASARDFLGGTLSLTGGQDNNHPLSLVARTTVTARAMRAAPRFAQWAGLLRSVDGQARVNVAIAAPATPNGALRIDARSALEGMAINLPPPFGKSLTSNEVLRFSQRAGPVPGQTEWLLDLDGIARARFTTRKGTANGSALASGGIAVGPSAPLPSPSSGVQVNVDLPVLDVDAWRGVLQQDSVGSGSSGAGSFALPERLSMHVGQLVAGGRHFDDVVLGATRSGALWQANLSSRQIAGYVGWRMGKGDAPGSLVARLTHLSLPRTADTDVERILDETPKSLPALNVQADDIDLHGHHFNHLDLRATNRGNPGSREWMLDHFVLTSPEATLTGSGSWGGIADNGRRRMAMGFKLSIDDAGSLLARLGKAGILRGGHGVMQGTVTWLGSPLAFDIPSLSGQLKLDLGRGQFLKADPGLAKLLGVLSLQSLPRRLLFNFSDVFESGFAFDQVSANVELDSGVATTHDFKMHGPAATVLLEGSADLAHETQDLYAVVVPEINAGSASLAYALINPAIGLGTFIAQIIARKPLMKAFTYGYRITGSWTKPTVTHVSNPAAAASTPAAP